MEIANHGDHAFLGPPSCQSQQQPKTRWEKFQRKSPIMAITLYSIALMPKTATIATGWEKLQGKPPIMATVLFLGRDCAKTRNNL